MGWTSKSYLESSHANYGILQAIDLVKTEIAIDGYELRGLAFRYAKKDKHIIYSVLRHPKGHSFALVTKVEIVDGDIFWKDIDETQGPVEANMPKALLKMLSPTRSVNANEWRHSCKENNKRIRAIFIV